MLARRAKQVEYGKNTVDYDKYIKMVKKDDRLDRMPRTPNRNNKYSRRQWDGMVKAWKQSIHATVAALESEGSRQDPGLTVSVKDEVKEEVV